MNDKIKIRFVSVKSHIMPSARHQLAFHGGMSVFWLLAMAAVPFMPTFQGIASLPALLIMEVSLYANFATEFGAISATQAVLQTEGKS